MRLRMITFRIVVLTVFGATAGAYGDMEWSEGHWRLELAGYGGMNTSNNKRTDDFGLVGTIEYETPIMQRATLSLRMQPLFFYSQNQDEYVFFRRLRQSRNFDPKYNDDNVYGLGFGSAVRVYQRMEDRTGFFGELALTAIVHDDKFIDNSSNLNFSTEIGLGYRFRGHWDIIGRWRHISNAGFGDDNSATNGYGVGVGYRF